MFCHKCGTQTADNAAFCKKCGAKMIADNNERSTTAQESPQSMQTQMQDAPSDTPRKKKLGKLYIILGVIALLIAAVVFVALNWEGKTDYEATVRAHQPFGITQGLSYTYEEVLDKYISSSDWEVRNSGDVNYVDVSGKAKGTNNELVVTIQVTADPSDADLAKIAPESVTIDGEKSPTQNDAVEFLLAMFLMYDEKYDDISDLFSETGIPSETKTMVGETKSYDNNFGNMEVTLDYVEFTDRTENTLLGGYIFPDEGSIFLRAAFTLKNIGTDKGSLITSWNTVVYDGEYEFSDSFVEGNLTDINPLSAPTTGSIIFTVPNDVAESDKPLVININDDSGEAVISYVIRPAASTSGENGTANSYPNVISYKGISISYLLESTDDVVSLLGDSPLNDELKLRYDDMEFYHDNGVITSLVSFDPSLFEADGITLNKNRDGLIKIFGEPSEEGDGGGGYFMSYNLSDCSMYFELGEPASEAWRVSISPSATTESVLSEVIYKGIPVKSLLEYSVDEATALFGEPTYDGAYLQGYTYEYNNEISFIFFEDRMTLIWIAISPEALTVNDVSLDKDRAFLIETFGEPTDEGVGEMTQEYEISYDWAGYTLNFTLPDSSSKISAITIYPKSA